MRTGIELLNALINCMSVMIPPISWEVGHLAVAALRRVYSVYPRRHKTRLLSSSS